VALSDENLVEVTAHTDWREGFMVNEAGRKISEGIFGTDEENYRQRIPCVIVMDCSGSMEGASIAALNEGLKKFEQELKIDEKARKSARVMLIRVGGFKGDPDEVQIRVPFQDTDRFSAPTEEPLARHRSARL
jgi:hypothetical protein